ncbi:MAG: DUF333 domain-containing protein [archaeon]|nr:MAG: DUF333 domain-containing protein [archaeon]
MAKAFLIAILLISILTVSGCVSGGGTVTTTTQTTIGMPNPAAVYCQDQGGTLEIREDPRTSGGQYGVCILENGTECDEWAYYRGGCESCLTYCAKQPHIQCEGHLEMSGQYPDCSCEWICD